MLILTRKEKEALILMMPEGDPMVVTLRDAKCGEAKIGIDAEDDMRIERIDIRED